MSKFLLVFIFLSMSGQNVQAYEKGSFFRLKTVPNLSNQMTLKDYAIQMEDVMRAAEIARAKIEAIKTATEKDISTTFSKLTKPISAQEFGSAISWDIGHCRVQKNELDSSGKLSLEFKDIRFNSYPHDTKILEFSPPTYYTAMLVPSINSIVLKATSSFPESYGGGSFFENTEHNLFIKLFRGKTAMGQELIYRSEARTFRRHFSCSYVRSPLTEYVDGPDIYRD